MLTYVNLNKISYFSQTSTVQYCRTALSSFLAFQSVHHSEVKVNNDYGTVIGFFHGLPFTPLLSSIEICLIPRLAEERKRCVTKGRPYSADWSNLGFIAVRSRVCITVMNVVNNCP